MLLAQRIQEKNVDYLNGKYSEKNGKNNNLYCA